jgi:hypothetical protein
MTGPPLKPAKTTFGLSTSGMTGGTAKVDAVRQGIQNGELPSSAAAFTGETPLLVRLFRVLTGLCP